MNDWHFPRPELAKQYLQLLEIGICSNLAIIAPRRKGKTLFVLQDLAPLARKKNYLPVYASLWQNINEPHEGLISALEETKEALEKRATISRLLNAKIKRTTVSNELLGRMDIEFADNPSKINSEALGYLEKLLVAIEKKAAKKTILLLIDEVQHLSTSPAFAPLTHTLRTMLDKRQGRVKAVFTGSSRHYMNLLFNESQSPFYHFVEPVPFPDLDEKFIAFLRQKLNGEYHRHVRTVDLVNAFAALDHSPYWMMKLVTHVITFNSSTEIALGRVLEIMQAAENFAGISSKMKPIDKIVFLGLCQEISPYSEKIIERVERETTLKGIASNIQRSLQRLAQLNLISQINKGEYCIEKPGLQQYLKENFQLASLEN